MTEEVSLVIVSDSAIPRGHLMFEGIETPEPLFSVAEVAKMFGRKASWIRWLDNNDGFVLKGEYVGGHRTDAGARRFQLADIERVAHALRQQDLIATDRMLATLAIVKGYGRVWGYL